MAQVDDLSGRVAFITGGGSGLGLAMAQALAGAGMKLVLADVDPDALDEASRQLAGLNVPVLTIELDVTDRAAFEAAARQAVDTFGAIHVLCNNAGVYRGGGLDKVTYADWDWVMGVNVGGVVNGLQSVLPHIKASGEGGHIVNTASLAGLTGGAGMGVYNASKFAVVGMSEALRGDLEAEGIGVSVLCPAMVRTRILESERTRPEDFAVTDETAEAAARNHSGMMHVAMEATAMDPRVVGQIVLDGIRENRFWLLTHPETKAAVAARNEELLASFPEMTPERAEMMERLQRAFMPDAED